MDGSVSRMSTTHNTLYLKQGERMKRMAFSLSILAVMLLACNLSATTTPPASGLPASTDLLMNMIYR
jgi:hypothetical protein